MNTKFYVHVFKELIKSDLLIFKQVVVNKLIDLTIWVILTTVVTAYIMPYFGLKNDFGVFQFAGIIAAVGLFELYSSIIEFLQDLEGDRVINYHLTLPIPSWVAIISKATYYFVIYFMLTMLMLPIGKLTLWNQLDLTQIFYSKLFLALIFQCLFYASFVILVSSIIKSMTNIGSVWSRFVFPMWFMGGFQFSWFALYNVSPTLAYINLLNPMIYITESTRVAILGQQDYINFWVCLLAIFIFSIVCLIIGIKKLKKRLDFI
jgi:ABC-2 type transport system permease protein